MAYRHFIIVMVLFVAACSGTPSTNQNSNNSNNENSSDNGTEVGVSSLGIWPLSRSATPDALNDSYGPRLLSDNYDFHRGIDMPAERGTPVYAPLAGIVKRVESTQPGDNLERLGNFVVVAHEPTEDAAAHQTVYQHLDSIAVTVGQELAQGDMIGTVGDSGVNINTVHLHFGYHIGEDDGTIHRENTRHPLRILPYTQEDPTVTLSRTDTELTLTITMAPGSMDLMRIVHQPNEGTEKVVDFETREGIDADDEDTNPFEGVTIEPSDFNQNSNEFQLVFKFAGDWKNLSGSRIVLTNARDQTESFEFDF